MGGRGYSCQIPEHIRCGRNIVHFEMYNIVVALATWAHNWPGQLVRIKSDNMAVVHAINNLRAQDTFLATCLRNALMTVACYGIHIDAIHIPGVENKKADALSWLMIDPICHEWVLEKVTLEPIPATAFALDEDI